MHEQLQKIQTLTCRNCMSRWKALLDIFMQYFLFLWIIMMCCFSHLKKKYLNLVTNTFERSSSRVDGEKISDSSLCCVESNILENWSLSFKAKERVSYLP